MEYIVCEKAPAAVGPYVHAVATKEIMFISGQLGLDPENGTLLEGIEAQTRQSLENLFAILEDADMCEKNLAKTTIFITDMEQFGIVNKIYAEALRGAKPARSCVEVSKLPKGALVEIEAIAVK